MTIQNELDIFYPTVKKDSKTLKSIPGFHKDLQYYLKQLLQNLQKDSRNSVSEFAPIKETVLRQNLNLYFH